MQATTAAVRVLEGGVTNNLRAVERFAAGTLKLGPILKAAFPLVGGLAFAGLIVGMGEKVYEFFKKASEGPARIANAFRELNAPLKLTNDELRVANDRLTNDIAKLEGRRQNTLQTALDEARVAADKLADSLEKDLKGLNKLLKEENVNALHGFVTDQAPTTALREQLGGKTGFGGFTGEVADITDKGQAKIDDAARRGDKKGQDAAVIELSTALEKKYGDEIAITTAKLAEFQKLQLAHQGANPLLRAVDPALDDQSANIELAKGALRTLRDEQERVRLSAQNTTLTQRKDADTAANANAKQDRPLQDKLKELDAQLTKAAAKLGAAGKSAAEQEALKASAAAVKAIEEVNKALERQHTKLDAAGEAAIRLREKSIALVTAEADWKTKLAATTNEIEDRIKSQKLLTAAIGQGYEATKKANAETAVMGFAKEHYNDPQWMKDHAGDVAGVRTLAGNEFDAKNAEQTATALEKLTDQIALEKKLATVQSQGEEAVRLATLAMKLQEIARHKGADAAKKLTQAEQDLFAAQRANTSAKNIAELNIEIDATRRLAAAQIQGAEAVRQTEIKLQAEKMGRAGATPQEISLSGQEDELKHQAAITAEVLKTANAGRNRLAELDKEEAAALKLKNTDADQLGVQIKLRDIENERLKIEAQQLLQFGGISDGVKAFFLEMEESAKSAASIIYDALNSTFDKLSENLAKLATGGKAHFAAMFKDIGQQMVQSTVKSNLQKGLAAFGNSPLGKKLGLAGLGNKKDGQTVSSALFVQVVGGTAAPGGTGAGPAAALGQPGSMVGSQGSGVSGLFSKALKFLGPLLGGLGGGGGDGLTPSVTSSFTPLAGGGDMSADKAYVVGEKGPEILRKTSGTITSNAQSRKLLSQSGGNHYYSIDARGTDPVLTEQRTRMAIMAAHNSAVSTGVQVQQEHLKRTPHG